MSCDSFEVRIKDNYVSAIKLAVWVKSITNNQFTSGDTLCIARCLIMGETWRPTQLFGDFRNNPYCSITIPENDEVKHQRESLEQQEQYFDLMRKGAAGDVAAAIEYCKLELDGKVSHGCFARG